MPNRVTRDSRQREIDLLRIVAMIAVFAVHAAEPFNPWDEWHVRSPERSKWLGELVLFLAPWVSRSSSCSPERVRGIRSGNVRRGDISTSE